MKWSDIEPKVFTQIEYYLKRCENAPYPNLYCTTKNTNEIPTSFPTLYLHDITSPEIGMDLQNIDVNGVMSSIEIQVYTKGAEKDAKNIIVKATNEMKRLGYSVTAFPIVTTNNNISVGIARYRRPVGMGDKF